LSLRVTILGSGTSSGVPVIGCECAVCRSTDPRNNRLRPSVMIEHGNKVLLIDTATDLRQQSLRFGIDRVDAVLYTHAHADHVLGLDELRIFNLRQEDVIPCFGSAETLQAIRTMFAYVFGSADGGGPRPRLDLRRVEGPFEVLEGLLATPIPLLHGDLPIYGYRLGRFAYLTDCSHIPEASFALLEGLDVLVLDALRYRPHRTHFSIDQALEAASRIGADRSYFTHLTHEVDHGNLRHPLPPQVELAYDGLAVDLA